jgi:TGF-beta propeptide
MKNLKTQVRCASLLWLILLAWTAYAQITPLGDSYTSTADPTTNYGAQKTLDVDAAKEITYIQFNLASVPATASISQATLKLYVNTVTTAGSFNVDYVSGSWEEGTIDASNAPPLGSAIASNIALTTSDKNQYILINVTSAVQAWLSESETNNGLALVANSSFSATFDSKENTTTSHPAELDIAFAGGDGTITGVTTASGSGLQGGGNSGTLNLSLTTACSSKQVLQWSGSAWTCSNAGTGTITGVTAGTGLSGGGTSGTVTLANTGILSLTQGTGLTISSGQTPTIGINTSVVPQLNAANTFTTNQAITGNVTASGTVTASSASISSSVLIDSGAELPLEVITTSSKGIPVYGQANSTTGNTVGVFGATYSSSSSAYGVYGYAGSASGSPIGVYGQTESVDGGTSGVFGQNGAISSVASGYAGSSGVWGDGGTNMRFGVIGTADGVDAGLFLNNASANGYFTLEADAENGSGYPFIATNFVQNSYCEVDNLGDLLCSGTKNAVVPIDGGKRMVAMSAIESPQNWFEDFGSAQLNGGSAVVPLDPDFIQTVNTEREYMVIPVPNGECNGLYVTNKTATSFEVRELGGGSSSIRFDYRIVALRKKYEDVRFADHTEDLDPKKMMDQMTRRTKNTRPQGPPVERPAISKTLESTTNAAAGITR